MSTERHGQRVYHLFHDVQRAVFLCLYLATLIGLAAGLVFLLETFFPALTSRLLVPAVLLLMVGGTALGAILWTVLDLPRIVVPFDRIKNDVASSAIGNRQEFGHVLVKFLCDFFSYSFLNVQFAFAQFGEDERSCSDNELLDIVPAEDLARAYRDSEKKDTPHLLRTYVTDTGRLNLYIVPIHFGPDWLGCFGILTTNKLLRPFLYFLMYFEDCLLDDVLFHVLSRERLEREIDAARAAKTYGVDL